MGSSMTTKSIGNESRKELKFFSYFNVSPSDKKKQKNVIKDNMNDKHVLRTKSKKSNILNCPNCRESLIVNITDNEEETEETQARMNYECEVPYLKQRSRSIANQAEDTFTKYNSRKTSFITDNHYTKQYLHRVMNHDQRPLCPPQFDYLPACQAYQNDDSMFFNCMNVPPLISMKGTCSHYPPCPLLPACPYPIPCYQRPNFAPVCHIPVPRGSLCKQRQYYEAPEYKSSFEDQCLAKPTSSAIMFSESENFHHSSTRYSSQIDRSSQYVTTNSNCNSVQSFLTFNVSSTLMVRDVGCQFQSRFLNEMLINNEVYSESPSFHFNEKATPAYKGSGTPSSHSLQIDKSPRPQSKRPGSRQPSCKQSYSGSFIHTNIEDLAQGSDLDRTKCFKCSHKRCLSFRKCSRSDTSCIKSSRKREPLTGTGSCSETSCFLSKYRQKLSRRGSCSDESCCSCELQKVVPLSILKKDDIAMHTSVKKTTGVKWDTLEIKQLYFNV